MDQLTALKKYAEDNYEQGAHWIVECWSNSEYQQLLADAGGNLSKAQDLLKLEWELICEQERAAAWE